MGFDLDDDTPVYLHRFDLVRSGVAAQPHGNVAIELGYCDADGIQPVRLTINGRHALSVDVSGVIRFDVGAFDAALNFIAVSVLDAGNINAGGTGGAPRLDEPGGTA